MQSLREIGMSTRAIAAATGVNRETVMKDVREVVGNQPPDPAWNDGVTAEQPKLKLITGTDALPPQFGTVAGELFRLSSRVERLRGEA